VPEEQPPVSLVPCLRNDAGVPPSLLPVGPSYSVSGLASWMAIRTRGCTETFSQVTAPLLPFLAICVTLVFQGVQF
jgi:hypothetical protein